ncbi:hypothetical protein BG006_006776 [Podila minutissima]|uniref:Uncharacterized protein n=1 Tax=Podila minutissima TaxID=64525 RepID=A0A9P5VQL2_9FUNG|nr:hypothetical protein BG006_006776 [Podila minutissima]
MERRRLQYHVQRLKASKETVFDELPEVTRLRINQSVQDSIHGYEIGTPLLKAELEDTTQELAAENQTLKESLEIKEALNARLADLAKAVEKGTTVFQLKTILEDIMNLSVSSPGDPYLVLERGSYYPPHIEQLINAGIAVRHPRDAQRLRLVDFYS